MRWIDNQLRNYWDRSGAGGQCAAAGIADGVGKGHVVSIHVDRASRRADCERLGGNVQRVARGPLEGSTIEGDAASYQAVGFKV